MSSYIHEARGASIRAFAGDHHEVCCQLDHLENGQVVVVLLGQSNQREVKVIEQVLLQIIQLTQSSLIARGGDSLAHLVAALLPKEMLSPTLLKEVQMQLRAKEAVLASGDWLSVADLAAIGEQSVKKTNAQLRKWMRDGAIFSIHHNGVEYFPGYALDPLREYRPYHALKEVIAQFAGTGDGWGLALWFHSPNSFLGGRSPRELLATQSDHVIEAAADLVLGVVHA